MFNVTTDLSPHNFKKEMILNNFKQDGISWFLPIITGTGARGREEQNMVCRIQI